MGEAEGTVLGCFGHLGLPCAAHGHGTTEEEEEEP